MSDRSRVIRAEEAAARDIRPLDLSAFLEAHPKEESRQKPFQLAEYLEEAGRKERLRFQAQFGAIDPEPLHDETELIEEEPRPSPEELIAEARAEAEAIREEAREEGRRAGYEAGLKAAEESLNQAVAELAAAVEEVAVFRGRLLERLKEEIVGLIVLAASKVVAKELESDRETVARLVDEALDHMRHDQWVTVRLNPDQAAMIEERKPQLVADHPHLDGIDIEADPEIEPGGCIVVSESEEVDATIGARLEVLGEIMERTLRGLTDGA